MKTENEVPMRILATASNARELTLKNELAILGFHSYVEERAHVINI